MATNDIDALVERVRRGEDVGAEDIQKTFAEIGFSERQAREILRHIKEMAENEHRDDTGTAQPGAMEN